MHDQMFSSAKCSSSFSIQRHGKHFGDGMNIKRLCILGRRRATHHEQELLEIDGAVAVPIDAPNHPLAGRQRRLLPHRPEHVVQLLRRYHPVPIPIVHRERPPQVVQPVAVAVAGAVDGDELVQADEAVAVGVGLAHRGGGVFGGAAEAEEDAAELGEGDASVAVGVELVEDAAEVVGVVAEAAEEGGGGGERGGRGRRLGFGAVASCEESGDAHSFDVLVFFLGWVVTVIKNLKGLDASPYL